MLWCEECGAMCPGREAGADLAPAPGVRIPPPPLTT